FGARYYDPRVSTWVSTDPALISYLPTREQLSGKDEPFDPGKLRGNGGIYNSINGNLYQYAKRNPLKFIDPDGKTDIDSWQTRFVVNIMNAFGGNENANQMATHQTSQLAARLDNSPFSPSYYGLSIRAFAGYGGGIKAGQLGSIDVSGKATIDAQGNLNVSLTLGKRYASGNLKVGYAVTGTILQNGEFKPTGGFQGGIDKKFKG
ncbi:MAG: hypothetical protein NZM44_03025, partial [Candidatus Calescibacterium sp.]|nr:hypothetical protein [Candidatus Calescibacterium sp.]